MKDIEDIAYGNAKKSFYDEFQEMPVSVEIHTDKLGQKIAFCKSKDNNEYAASITKNNTIKKTTRTWGKV